MFERFTRSARDAVTEAQAVARDRDADRIGVEHLLLGTLRHVDGEAGAVLREAGLEPDAVGSRFSATWEDEDADALAILGIDLDDVRRRVESTFGSGALNQDRTAAGRRGHLPFTREAKKVLELTLREAIWLGDRRIGAEHLAMAITRSPGPRAAALIRAAGADAGQLHQQLRARLGRAA